MQIDYEVLVNENIVNFEKKFIYFLKKVKKELNLSENLFLEVDIVDDCIIHDINKQYRGVDSPTDVISFAFNDESDGEVKIINPEINFLGCIYINYQRAQKQAIEIGNTFEREMCFLFVHGLLHLLGYDHIKKEDEDIMFSLQRKIFEGEKL